MQCWLEIFCNSAHHDDFVSKFKRVVGRPSFHDQFKKIIQGYKRVGYRKGIMWQSVCRPGYKPNYDVSFLLFVFRVCLSSLTALWSPAGRGLTSWFLCVVLSCIFVTFPSGVLGWLWYLIVSIPDLCLFLIFIAAVTSLIASCWVSPRTQWRPWHKTFTGGTVPDVCLRPGPP